MKRLFLTILLTLCLFGVVKTESPYVVVLGTAQDAGAPQIGCDSPFCKRAWKNKRLRKMVSSLALVNPDTKERWIFDATPDLPAQFQLLKEVTRDFSNNLNGIFLTHAHIGHYTGLMYFGKESLNAKSINVYAMPRMRKMLKNNAPWSQLVSFRNILIKPLRHRTAVNLTPTLEVQPFIVPHRDEFSETVGYRIKSSKKSLVFIPDIDKWQKWNQSLAEVVKTNDYVFVDATFYQDGEIPRPINEVPHPFVSETMGLLKNLPTKEKNKVHFIHFNHSNPLIQGDKRKKASVENKGFRVSHMGMRIQL